MSLELLLPKLPLIVSWIDKTLAMHAGSARPVWISASKGCRVFIHRIYWLAQKRSLSRGCLPPLTALGLPEFAAFEQGDYAGITFKDTYFIKSTEASNESLHFHELVHVVQWAHLGVEKFLLQYAAGLATSGYRNSPLEVMAYGLQDYFDHNGQAGDVENAIREQTKC